MPKRNEEQVKQDNRAKRLSALKRRHLADIFGSARLRIVLLYITMGTLIFGAAEYLLYGHILVIIQNALPTAEKLLSNQSAAIDQAAVNNIVFQSVLAEIRQVDAGTLIWILLTLVLLAWLFAGITLNPIRRLLQKQQRFASHVSHELRTPLSVMKAASEIAFVGAAPPSREELLEILRNTLEEVDRMTEVIEFFFTSAAWEEQRKLEFAKVDLAAITRKAAKLMEGKAVERGISLTPPTETPVFIQGNAVMLEGLLVNLLKNAIAYTSAGGSVTVTVRPDGRKATLVVRDTGIGIPPKDLPNIFKAFYRGENAVSRQTRRKGTGIGLTIVKEIADLHQARVGVQSALGEGTTVSVAFRLSPR